jgi:hypothetical protein
MPRLQRDRPGEAAPRHTEKRVRDREVEGEAWGQLDQQRAEPRAERGDLREETFERFHGVDQPPLVGDVPRDLGAEPEVGRNRLGPAGIGRRPVGTVKARVDLSDVESAAVAGEMPAFARKIWRHGTRDRPTGRADPDALRHDA